MGDFASELALHAWEAGLRGVPILLAALILARGCRRLPAAVHHAIWCAAVIGQSMLFVSPAIMAELAVPGLPGWASPTQHTDVPPAVRAPSTDLAAAGPVTHYGSPRSSPAASVRGRSFSPFPFAWWAGVGVSLFALALGRLRRRAWRRGAVAAPPAMVEQVRSAASAIGLWRRVRIMIGPGCGTPVTWGVLRPVVLLPPGADAWPRDRLRAVLLHELAHVRRLDAFTRGLAEVLSVLLWFDPLVRLAAHAMRESAEAACDDAVVTAGLRPSRYVRHLVDIAHEALAPPPAGSHAVVRKRMLERRVAAILDPRARRARPSPAAAALAGAVTAVLALPLGALVPDATQVVGEREPVCPYTDGRHLDVVRAATWIVEWEGAGCSVAVRADADVTFAGDLSGVIDTGDAGSLSIEVRQPDVSRRLRITSGKLDWQVNGRTLRFDAHAEAWLADFLIELDRHTGFAVDARMPRLLDAGGPDLVIAEASRTRGGHAGAVYLQRLVEDEALDPVQIARLLDVAAHVVHVDAAMADLLAAVRVRYDVASLPLASAYATAAGKLEARAAREAAFDAIR
jgi:beta-lactamase regulating signal transducer with metallopeptidase domain